MCLRSLVWLAHLGWLRRKTGGRPCACPSCRRGWERQGAWHARGPRWRADLLCRSPGVGGEARTLEKLGAGQCTAALPVSCPGSGPAPTLTAPDCRSRAPHTERPPTVGTCKTTSKLRCHKTHVTHKEMLRKDILDNLIMNYVLSQQDVQIDIVT